jgi:hypothetical protein
MPDSDELRRQIAQAREQRLEDVIKRDRTDRRQIEPARLAGYDGSGRPLVRSLGGNALPLAAVGNVQGELGQLGRSDGRGFDVGSRSQKQRFKGRESSDPKQLVLIRRPTTDELWVRSPTAAILLSSGNFFVSACSLSSTGSKITDFVALVSSGGGPERQNGLERFDGQQRSFLHRAGNFVDTNPYIPRTLCLAKRGFWISIPQTRFVNNLPINPNLEYQAIPIIILVDLFHPPIRIGLFEYTKIYGVETIEKTTLDYYFSSYWQAGSNPVQEISSCRVIGISTRTIHSSSGGETFVSTIEEILNLASDDFGTLVRRTFAEGSGEYSGYRPVGLGTKKSRVRLLYNHDANQYEYKRNDAVLGIFTLGIGGVALTIDLSNASFDEHFLYLGHLASLNRVTQYRYPLDRAYDEAYRTSTEIEFFAIPNTSGLSFDSWDPNSGKSRPEAEYLAIAYDIGEKLDRQYPVPDRPPEGGGGGGGDIS